MLLNDKTDPNVLYAVKTPEMYEWLLNYIDQNSVGGPLLKEKAMQIPLHHLFNDTWAKFLRIPPFNDPNSLYFYALKYGHLELIKLLYNTEEYINVLKSEKYGLQFCTDPNTTKRHAVGDIACYAGLKHLNGVLVEITKMKEEGIEVTADGTRIAAELGYCDLLTDLIKLKTEIHPDALNAAIVYGHKQIVNKLKVNPSLTVSEDAIDRAAANGHDTILTIVLTYNRGWKGTKNTMDIAAENGHVNVLSALKRLRFQRDSNDVDNPGPIKRPWICYSMKGLVEACKNGYLDVVKWIAEDLQTQIIPTDLRTQAEPVATGFPNGFPIQSALNWACAYSRLNIVKWIMESYGDAIQEADINNACYWAANSGFCEALGFLRLISTAREYNHEMLVVNILSGALWSDNAKIVYWLHEQGYAEFSGKVIDLAGSCDQSVFKVLASESYPMLQPLIAKRKTIVAY